MFIHGTFPHSDKFKWKQNFHYATVWLVLLMSSETNSIESQNDDECNFINSQRSEIVRKLKFMT